MKINLHVRLGVELAEKSEKLNLKTNLKSGLFSITGQLPIRWRQGFV